MSNSTIGIKVADGSYYPVIEADFRGTRKLVLTTSKDNQKKVQVDLYRGNGSSISEARYIGSVTIENILPAAQGEPEIELLIGIDDDDKLMAEAFDKSTGERQRFDTSLADSPEERVDFEEPPLTGEDYPVGERDRREEALRRRGPNILLLVLFVVLGIALVGAIAYFVYGAVSGPVIPPLPTTGAAAPAQPGAARTPPPPAAVSSTPAAPAPAAAVPAPSASAPAPASPAPAASSAGSVTYRIKKGDTLWDISATYYRNPWLYPRLAKANSISNPDLIFAGTRITIPQN
ncbi:MAG: LysM peptidoglycan-binding domain-containing protein [Spirochaetia bacterium]